MRKFLTALSACAFAISLWGVSQDTVRASEHAKRSLSAAEMSATLGRGYICNVPICSRPGSDPGGCNRTRSGNNNFPPYYTSFYNPGTGVGTSSAGGPPINTTTKWCSIVKYYSDPNCQTYAFSDPTTYAGFCLGGG